MTPLLTIQQFLKEIESEPELTLSQAHLEDYFEKLTLLANTPEGYTTLCWQAGEWLLLLAGERQDHYFNRYGYVTIGIALATALADGALPAGLGWYLVGFVPNDVDGDLMLSVLSHPTIQSQVSRSLRKHGFRLDLTRLAPDDQPLGYAAVRFLANLHRCGLDRAGQLRWAAGLVKHFSPENPARDESLRLVLAGLIETQRYVNAFYWLQAYFIDRMSAALNDVIFEVVSNIVELALNMAGPGDQILARLSHDPDLERLLAAGRRTRLFFGLLLLWLLGVRGIWVHPQSIERTIELLWQDYPNLSIFVNIFSTWAFQIVQQSPPAGPSKAALDYLRAPHQKTAALAELAQELADLPAGYRGRPATEVWQSCRDTTFAPLLARLPNANNKQLEALKKEISALSPETLIEQSLAAQPAPARAMLNRQMRHMIATDFQEYCGKLTMLVELCYQTNLVNLFIEQIEGQVVWIELYQETEALSAAWPTLGDHIRTYFLPIIDACAGAR